MTDTMAFLGNLDKVILIDSLTIGPMGKTALFLDTGRLDEENIFRALQVVPTALRILSAPNVLFSRLL
jgi:hypothetical protein